MNQSQPIIFKPPTLWQIVATALVNYPHSENMRQQLVRKTCWLLDNGKHAFQNSEVQS